MNFKQNLVLVLPALLCGVLLGYLFAPTPSLPVEEPAAAEETPAVKKAPRVAADEAALNRLRSRIQDLERQLAARDSQPVEAEIPIEASTNQPPERREGPGGPFDFRARMEEMAKNDPERFAQMTNQFARMRSDYLNNVQGRLEMLANIDMTHMDAKQRDVHARYQELLAQQTELRDMMRPDAEGMTDEQRRELFQQMREVDQQVRELAGEERNTLLRQAAYSLGLKGDNATDAVEAIKSIFRVTEGDRGGPPGGFGGFGGGRGGGRGGRGGRR